jgi:hypothetical protein
MAEVEFDERWLGRRVISLAHRIDPSVPLGDPARHCYRDGDVIVTDRYDFKLPPLELLQHSSLKDVNEYLMTRVVLPVLLPYGY